MPAIFMQFLKKSPGPIQRKALPQFYQLHRVQPFTVVAGSKHREPDWIKLFHPNVQDRKGWLDILGHSLSSELATDEMNDVDSVLLFYDEVLYKDEKPPEEKLQIDTVRSECWPVTVDELAELWNGNSDKLKEIVGDKKAEEISVEIAASKMADDNIRLHGCSAGRYSKKHKKNLVQALANKTGRYIIAATANGYARGRPLPDNEGFGIEQKDPNRGYSHLDPKEGSWVLFTPGNDEKLERPYRVLGREENGEPVRMGGFINRVPWIDICTEEAEKLIAEDKLKKAEEKLLSLSNVGIFAEADPDGTELETSIVPMEEQDMTKMEELE